MEFLRVVHTGLANTTLLFMLALGIWGLWNFFRGEGVTGSYWGALAIGEGVTVVEGVVGIALIVAGSPGPARGWLHVLYGAVAMLCIPAAFSFTRGRSTRQEVLVYAVIALFLAGIAVRAQTTGLFGG